MSSQLLEEIIRLEEMYNDAPESEKEYLEKSLKEHSEKFNNRLEAPKEEVSKKKPKM